MRLLLGLNETPFRSWELRHNFIVVASLNKIKLQIFLLECCFISYFKNLLEMSSGEEDKRGKKRPLDDDDDDDDEVIGPMPVTDSSNNSDSQVSKIPPKKGNFN